MVKLFNNKVSPGKINHKNAKKSCQTVLFSSKKALVVPLLSTAKKTKPGLARSARWHKIKTKSDCLSQSKSPLSEYVDTDRTSRLKSMYLTFS